MNELSVRERERPCEQVEPNCHPECLPQAQRRQKQESRGECPRDGASGIDPIKTRQARSQLGRIARESSHKHGQCAAHQKRRKEEYEGSSGEPQS